MHTQLSKYQAEAYEWLHRNYRGRIVELPAVDLAEVLEISTVGAGFILNRLHEYGFINFIRYANKKGGAKVFQIPYYKRKYVLGGRNTGEYASPRNMRLRQRGEAKQQVLDLINKNATPDRATAWKLTQRQIAAAIGASPSYVFQLIKELEREGKIVKANHTDRGGKSTVYDQSDTIAVIIDGKHALIRGRFTVSFPPDGA